MDGDGAGERDREHGAVVSYSATMSRGILGASGRFSGTSSARPPPIPSRHRPARVEAPQLDQPEPADESDRDEDDERDPRLERGRQHGPQVHGQLGPPHHEEFATADERAGGDRVAEQRPWIGRVRAVIAG
ncbi:MAG: hypothetical protein ACK56F_15700 [bacterium]